MDLQKAKESVIDLCKKAGDITREYFSSEDLSIQSKGGFDFLTHADREVDSFLKKNLQNMFPQTEVLTEESAPDDYHLLKDAEFVWIVDPIDGTTNFSRNDPHFSISVALVRKSKPVLGIVYLPLEDKLYVADTDSDALCNGQKISVSVREDLSIASIGVDYPWEQSEREKTVQALSKVATNVRQPRSLGCASADICLVAEGKLDGYFIYGIKPWDHAAANLIVEKAGGKVTQVDGSEWNVFDSNILATNGLLHNKLISHLS